ncbi:hypothetical protein J121_2728 [Qipengyuania citrea LAMA 915]|uniref:Uncharacterized protein n=1 Tax=Qipengyuania citrea LAMA 915 TaxID=1306953 RepID=A0A0L1KFX0_9SPHN|nr:hypothetical protein J121_2728 [Qipengyuania citrea LAMA 915]
MTACPIVVIEPARFGRSRQKCLLRHSGSPSFPANPRSPREYS